MMADGCFKVPHVIKQDLFSSKFITHDDACPRRLYPWQWLFVNVDKWIWLRKSKCHTKWSCIECTDSSSNVCIEDSYVSNGDDVVAIKSGWDEYGIAYGRPSSNIIVRRVTGITAGFSGIAIGSETSGGIRDILIQHVNILNSGTGIRLKTNVGRGGIITNITISDIYMENVRTAIKFTGNTGDHPDERYNPQALPVVRNIALNNVVGRGIGSVGSMEGIKGSPFLNICLSNIMLQGAGKELSWTCEEVEGSSIGTITPPPCAQLTSQMSSFCHSSFLHNH